MRKYLSRRAALDRTSSGDRIPELRIVGVGGEVSVVRQPSGWPRLARRRGEGSVAGRCGVSGRDAGERLRRLKCQSRHALGVFLRTEQGASRRTGRNAVGESARGKWTEAIFQGQSAKGQETPIVKIAPADLAD